MAAPMEPHNDFTQSCSSFAASRTSSNESNTDMMYSLMTSDLTNQSRSTTTDDWSSSVGWSNTTNDDSSTSSLFISMCATNSGATSNSTTSRSANRSMCQSNDIRLCATQNDDNSAATMHDDTDLFFPSAEFTGKRLLVMRHGERVDRVFPEWTQKAFRSGKYKPYNLNMPLSLPPRPTSHYARDTPLTEMGVVSAQMVGRGLVVYRVRPSVIVSSPALRCVQTAVSLLKTLRPRQPMLIRIEPGLFASIKRCEEQPMFLDLNELVELGYPVDVAYKPIITVNDMWAQRTTKTELKQSMKMVIQTLVEQSEGTMLVVAHASTVDLAVRSLLATDGKISETDKLDELEELNDLAELLFPFCALVAFEQTVDNSWRVLDDLLPPITSSKFSSRIDYQHLNGQKGVKTD